MFRFVIFSSFDKSFLNYKSNQTLEPSHQFLNAQWSDILSNDKRDREFWSQKKVKKMCIFILINEKIVK